jgi:hypothetical protein
MAATHRNFIQVKAAPNAGHITDLLQCRLLNCCILHRRELWDIYCLIIGHGRILWSTQLCLSSLQAKWLESIITYQKLSNTFAGLDRPWSFQKFEASRFHEGGKVASLTHRALLPQRKYSWYSRMSQPLGQSAAGRIRSMKMSNYTIGNRTRDLAACGAVPWPTALPRFPGC